MRNMLSVILCVFIALTLITACGNSPRENARLNTKKLREIGIAILTRDADKGGGKFPGSLDVLVSEGYLSKDDIINVSGEKFIYQAAGMDISDPVLIVITDTSIKPAKLTLYADGHIKMTRSKKEITEKQFKQIFDYIKNKIHTPKKLSSELMIDSIKAEPYKTIVYRYSLIGINFSPTNKKKMSKFISQFKNESKSDKDINLFRNSGITLIYKYYYSDGVEGGTIKLPPR